IGQPEVARRTVQAGERAEVAEAVMEPDAEQREIAGLNPLLQLVAFRLRQATCCDRGVDPIRKRLLECIAELARRDAELGRSVVDDRLALLARRVALGGRDRDAGPGGCPKGRGPGSGASSA